MAETVHIQSQPNMRKRAQQAHKIFVNITALILFIEESSFVFLMAHSRGGRAQHS